mmetsp:Transcript_9364/g.28209  ORF Transcript_9364/g.28209 Transcript_9364/m.28209 type:complete len:479 (-) Transcript_9364:1653-3089(-)
MNSAGDMNAAEKQQQHRNGVPLRQKQSSLRRRHRRSLEATRTAQPSDNGGDKSENRSDGQRRRLVQRGWNLSRTGADAAEQPQPGKTGSFEEEKPAVKEINPPAFPKLRLKKGVHVPEQDASEEKLFDDIVNSREGEDLLGLAEERELGAQRAGKQKPMQYPVLRGVGHGSEEWADCEAEKAPTSNCVATNTPSTKPRGFVGRLFGVTGTSGEDSVPGRPAASGSNPVAGGKPLWDVESARQGGRRADASTPHESEVKKPEGEKSGNLLKSLFQVGNDGPSNAADSALIANLKLNAQDPRNSAGLHVSVAEPTDLNSAKYNIGDCKDTSYQRLSTGEQLETSYPSLHARSARSQPTWMKSRTYGKSVKSSQSRNRSRFSVLSAAKSSVSRLRPNTASSGGRRTTSDGAFGKRSKDMKVNRIKQKLALIDMLPSSTEESSSESISKSNKIQYMKQINELIDMLPGRQAAPVGTAAPTVS